MTSVTTDGGSVEEAKTRLVLELGRALHLYGTPAHRIEATLSEVAAALGVDGSFFSTPTALFSSLKLTRGEESPAAPRPHTHLERLPPSEFDLGKLGDVDALARRLLEGELSVDEATEELRGLFEKPRRYPTLLRIVGGGCVSTGAAALFGGGAAEVGLALVCGLLLGIAGALALERPRLYRLYEPLGAILIAFVAAVGGDWLGVPRTIATLAGLIVLVPGLSLTRAFTELAQGSLVSGTSRLFGAILSFLMLGFGVVLGTRLAEAAGWLPVVIEPDSLPSALQWLGVVLSALGFVWLFDADKRDAFWILLASLGVAFVARAASPELGVELGAFCGAVAVGVLGNAFARFRRRPSLVVRVPALLLLVPGSFGYRSISSLMAKDAIEGVTAAFTVAVVAIALVAGLLVANAILPPRENL